MEREQKKEKDLKKIIFGFLLIIIPLLAGMWKYILDWSTGELQTFNELTILTLFYGSYLIIRGFNQETDFNKKETTEKIKLSWKRFNWFFWILLYLFATVNGHISRSSDMGFISRRSGIGIVSSAQYIILPIMMAALLYITASVFCSKRLSMYMAILGLIMSNYIYNEISFNISYTVFCLILGAVVFGVVWYHKNKEYKKVLQNNSK